MQRYSGRSLHRRRSGGPTISRLSALSPFGANQPPVAAYSLHRINPAYGGHCMRVRDSNNALRTIDFDADGNLNTAALAAYGNGVNFTVANWYDQSGGGVDLSSTVRPPLVFPNAPADYSGAFIDFQSKNQHLASSATPLSTGGTANLSVFAVASTAGWSSAGTHSRAPAVYSSGVRGAMIGFGTTSAGSLLFGADGPDGETTLYGRTGELLVDAAADFTDRWRNVWFNQAGALVSGGADSRTLFAGRPHGASAASAQRIVVGNNGAINAGHNGGVREIILFNNAGGLPDKECAAIARWQAAQWTGLGKARFPKRFVSIFSGQSNAQYYGVSAASGDGSAGSDAHARIYAPALRNILQIPADASRELSSYSGANTAIGASSIVKTAAQISSGKYWWDSDTASPGPSLVSWMTNVNHSGSRYRNTVIMWSQGEAEALMLSGGDNIAAQWKAQTKLVWQAMRNHIGYDCPILIQPLGKQTGHQAAMNILRAIQSELAEEVAGVTIGPETTDLALQDSVHFAPFTQSANGYDLGANRLAQAVGSIMSLAV